MGLAERGVISPHRRADRGQGADGKSDRWQTSSSPRSLGLHVVMRWSSLSLRGSWWFSTQHTGPHTRWCFLPCSADHLLLRRDGWLADTGVRGDFFAPHNICAHSDGPIGKRLRLLPASAFLNSHTSRWLAMVFDGLQSSSTVFQWFFK